MVGYDRRLRADRRRRDHSAVQDGCTDFILGKTFVGERETDLTALRGQEHDGIRNDAVDQLGEARRLGRRAQRHGEHRDFQILTSLIPVFGNANVAGLEGGKPQELVDPFHDLPPVGGGGITLLHEHLLRHALVDAGLGGQCQGSDDRSCAHPASASGRTTRNATTSKSLIP